MNAFEELGLSVGAVLPLGMGNARSSGKWTMSFSEVAAVHVDPKSKQRTLLFSGGGATGFDSVRNVTKLSESVFRCPLTPEVAALLRRFPDAPKASVPPRTGFSFGGGDRLRGFGTRAHLRSLSKFPDVFPILAQQSVRENQRLGRTAQSVMDDTFWAVIESGWVRPWGADADHQKTLDNVTEFLAAGFTLVTCDPGEHVVNISSSDTHFTLDHVDWQGLEMTEADARKKFEVERSLRPGQKVSLPVAGVDAMRAIAKYGNAVVHAKNMYRHAVSKRPDVAFELSVDEIDSTTTPVDHYVIAELCRHLGMELWSIAPRFVGRFNKGVDYIGDVDALRQECYEHALVAGLFGGHKVSVHSGSDKFSIYRHVRETTEGHVHLKTSGTSYLAALQVVACIRPSLFRKLFEFALERYAEASKSYHVDANVGFFRAEAIRSMKTEDLTALVLGYDGRQILHVSFGDILREFGSEVLDVLAQEEAFHIDMLSAHMNRHLRPFAEEV